MKITQLLESKLSIPEGMASELRTIETMLPEDFDYKDEYTIPDIVSNFIKTIHLQKQSADRNSHPTLGFYSLVQNLGRIGESSCIYMRMIESENWGGRIYFDDQENLLGVFIGKKNKKNWKTPPNWDGSLRMLEEYNKHPSKFE